MAGNRTTQNIDATSGPSSGDSVTTYTMHTAGHAHALSSTSTTGPGAGTTSYTYNGNGAQTARNLPSGNQTLTYNAEQQLATVTTPAGTTTYINDADGNQLVRQDPATTTLYLPDEELVRNNSTGTIAGTRYYAFNGAVIALRVGRAMEQFLDSDPHGTAEIALPITSTGSGTPIRRYLDPYGNPLGATTGGTWPDNHAFLNQPADSATGLDDLGARDYDPTTGRFTQADPILETASPQQANGYTYGANNPVANADSTGQCIADAGYTCGGKLVNPAAANGTPSGGTPVQQQTTDNQAVNNDASQAAPLLGDSGANSGTELNAYQGGWPTPFLTHEIQQNLLGDYNQLQALRTDVNQYYDDQYLTSTEEGRAQALWWMLTFAVQRLYVLTHHLPTPMGGLQSAPRFLHGGCGCGGSHSGIQQWILGSSAVRGWDVQRSQGAVEAG